MSTVEAFSQNNGVVNPVRVVLKHDGVASGHRSDMLSVGIHFEATLASVSHGLRYLGPTLRGVFGHILKRTVCLMPSGECPDCRLRQACPYTRIFEGVPPVNRRVMRRYNAVPQPFVLMVAPPETWDGSPATLRWGMRVFGDACDMVPYLIEAFIRCGRAGIGRHRVPYRIDRVVSDDGQVVYDGASEHLTLPVPVPLHGRNLPERACTLRWRFITPVHIRSGGGLAVTPSGLDLLLAGRRRWHILQSFYGQEHNEEPVRLEKGAFSTVGVRLYPWYIKRFSGRQGRSVPLSGVLGELDISGPWHQAGDWLRMVEQVHIGKYVSFGFGKVHWEVIA